MENDALTLTPPEPVAPVPTEKAAGRVRLKPEEAAKLDAQVGEFVNALVAEETQSKEFTDRVQALAALGNADVARSASVSNRMLERPANAMKAGPLSPSSTVSKGLVELRTVVESLDPTKRRDLLSPRKLLGMIPLGAKIRSYFDGYQSAQSHLNAIIQSLYRGKDELLMDNAAIEREKQQMWSLMEKLEAAIYLCEKIDAALSAKIAELQESDPERARIVREDVLFPARQKKVDLLTQMAVNIQGYQALELVKRNNTELIKGVDRATTTTLSALRTAVMTAQALAGQRLVLDQITALNATTGAMIESTSQMLKGQSATIQQQASSATVDVERLRRAFDNIYAAMDAVDAYKGKAVESLAKTADALRSEIDRAQARLAPYRLSVAREETRSLTPPPDSATPQGGGSA
jgi:uncharacterized protein YaaN involved in tellurite resistance